jgi:hypothetical protein
MNNYFTPSKSKTSETVTLLPLKSGMKDQFKISRMNLDYHRKNSKAVYDPSFSRLSIDYTDEPLTVTNKL